MEENSKKEFTLTGTFGLLGHMFLVLGRWYITIFLFMLPSILSVIFGILTIPWFTEKILKIKMSEPLRFAVACSLFLVLAWIGESLGY